MSHAAPQILVADDCAQHRALAREVLEAAGFMVVEADDGSAALKRALSGELDLAIIDVVMPRMNGLEVIKVMRGKLADSCPPIMVLSARSGPGARIDGLRAGADDYLGKPFEGQELIARVQGLLGDLKMQAAAKRGAQQQSDHSGVGLHATGAAANQAPSDPAVAGSQPVQSYDELVDHLGREFDRATRYSDPLSLLRIEVHSPHADPSSPPEGGGEALTERLLQAFSECMRPVDRLFFDGSGGFAMVLPNSHFSGALALAERIVFSARARMGCVTKKTASGESAFELNDCELSVGVAFYPSSDVSSASQLEQIAQTAVRTSRSEGGGRICLYQHKGYIYAPKHP